MKNWLLAIRPKTLFASLAPVILGLAVAFYETGKLNLLIALLTALCALFLQIASNLANDYLDAKHGVDNEDRLGPTRVTSSGLIEHTKVKKALIAALFLSLLLGIYLMFTGGIVIVVIGLLSLYFAYGYTGGPFPLSYNGLGEVAAFIFYGIFAVFGTSYLQTGEFTQLSLISGIGPGFISACILAVNNLRDIKSDTDAKKRTIAVRFGEIFQRRLCLVLILLSLLSVIPLILSYHLWYSFLVLIVALLFHKTWLQILYAPIDRNLNQALARTAQYNLVYCLVLSLVLLHQVLG